MLLISTEGEVEDCCATFDDDEDAFDVFAELRKATSFEDGPSLDSAMVEIGVGVSLVPVVEDEFDGFAELRKATSFEDVHSSIQRLTCPWNRNLLTMVKLMSNR